jgi:hypothetical protein
MVLKKLLVSIVASTGVFMVLLMMHLQRYNDNKWEDKVNSVYKENNSISLPTSTLLEVKNNLIVDFFNPFFNPFYYQKENKTITTFLLRHPLMSPEFQKYKFTSIEDVIYYIYKTTECNKKPVIISMAIVGSLSYWQL